MEMTRAIYQAFRELAYAQAGIHLRDGKETLVAARIGRRVRLLGLSGPAEYLDWLRSDASGTELTRFIDAISTNFTSFFRERDHFDTLEQVARSALGRDQRRFRVWCAAASTGEEPYSIAMTLAEAFGGDAVDCKVLATDISTRALDAARAGRYTEAQLAPVPRNLRAKYFERTESSPAGEPTFDVDPELRTSLVFKRLNLAKPPFPMSGPIDVVFCRNVMIYFDTPVRQGLITEIERLLRPGGVLIVGHSETLNGIRTKLTPQRPSVYRRALSQ